MPAITLTAQLNAVVQTERLVMGSGRIHESLGMIGVQEMQHSLQAEGQESCQPVRPAQG